MPYNDRLNDSLGHLMDEELVRQFREAESEHGEQKKGSSACVIWGFACSLHLDEMRRRRAARRTIGNPAGFDEFFDG